MFFIIGFSHIPKCPYYLENRRTCIINNKDKQFKKIIPYNDILLKLNNNSQHKNS